MAAAEMAFAGGLGIKADLNGLAKSEDCVRSDVQLFSESNSRYIVEVAQDNFDKFAKLMLDIPFGQIGNVTEDKKLVIVSQDNKKVVDVDIDTLKAAWQKPLNLS